jgi:hypothetical protein
MIRIILVTLAAVTLAACSQPGSSQSTPANQPAPAASQPAGNPSETPAATPPSTQPATPPSAAASSTTPASGQSAAPPAPQPPAPPPPPPAPKFQDVTIPAGTAISVTVLNTLASDTSKVEDAVKGSVAKSVVVSDLAVLPAGTQMTGTVVEANPSGRVKGKASLVFRFDHVVVDRESMRIQTAKVIREAAADTKSDAKKGGLGAAAGAVVGGIAGGGKGAAIGAVAGGAGTVMATKGKEVTVPAGTVVSVILQDPLTVQVQIK